MDDKDKITYAKYTVKFNAILKDGHKMFPKDIANDLNRKSYLEELVANYRDALVIIAGQDSGVIGSTAKSDCMASIAELALRDR